MIGRLYQAVTRNHSVCPVVQCDYAAFEESTLASAPRDVRDAILECMKYRQVNLPPPSELVSLIRNWVYKGQDRYGK